MLCEECGTPTGVVTTYNDGQVVHRKRQCENKECGWYCVTQERFIDDYYDIPALRRRDTKRRLLQQREKAAHENRTNQS